MFVQYEHLSFKTKAYKKFFVEMQNYDEKLFYCNVSNFVADLYSEMLVSSIWKYFCSLWIQLLTNLCLALVPADCCYAAIN